MCSPDSRSTYDNIFASENDHEHNEREQFLEPFVRDVFRAVYELKQLGYLIDELTPKNTTSTSLLDPKLSPHSLHNVINSLIDEVRKIKFQITKHSKITHDKFRSSAYMKSRSLEHVALVDSFEDDTRKHTEPHVSWLALRLASLLHIDPVNENLILSTCKSIIMDRNDSNGSNHDKCIRSFSKKQFNNKCTATDLLLNGEYKSADDVMRELIRKQILLANMIKFINTNKRSLQMKQLSFELVNCAIESRENEAAQLQSDLLTELLMKLSDSPQLVRLLLKCVVSSSCDQLFYCLEQLHRKSLDVSSEECEQNPLISQSYSDTTSGKRFNSKDGLMQNEEHIIDSSLPVNGPGTTLAHLISVNSNRCHHGNQIVQTDCDDSTVQSGDCSGGLTSHHNNHSRQDIFKIHVKTCMINYETVFKYGLINPRCIQEKFANPTNSCFSALSMNEMHEALRNAISQLNRLQRYRTTQKVRYEQLQERLDHITCELDASVDTIRYHQSNYELQKRRSTMEISHLRTQVARLTTLLDQQRIASVKQKAHVNSIQTERDMRANSTSPTTGSRPITPFIQPINYANTDLSNDLKLKLSIAETEIKQLHTEMAKQSEKNDKENAKLRGQIVELTSDCRSLRLQLTRATNSNSSNHTINHSDTFSDCINCQKLQRLVDILQTKGSATNAIHNPSGTQIPDLITPQGRLMNAFVQTEESILINQIIQDGDNGDDAEWACTRHKLLSIDVGVQSDSLLSSITQEQKSSQTDMTQLSGINKCPVDIALQNDDTYLCGETFFGEKMSISTDFSTLRSFITPTNTHYIDKLARTHLGQKVSSEITSSPFNCSETPNGISSEAQLWESRARTAEQEAALAMDQLKASNAEFLNLRERLSHASVERAHLKATVDGLDEQVLLLESSLYQRTEQLHECQNLLHSYFSDKPVPSVPAVQNDVGVIPVIETISKEILSVNPIITDTSKNWSTKSTPSTVINFDNIFQREKLHFPDKLPHIKRTVHMDQLVSVCRRLFNLINRAKYTTHCLFHRLTKYSNWKLISQPRANPILLTVAYFVLIHLLLLHCWLF